MLGKILVFFVFCLVLMIQQVAVESRNPICSLPPQTGRCRAFFRRYYYNPDEAKCKTFIYGGCDPNKNNFRTLADCEKVCCTKTR